MKSICKILFFVFFLLASTVNSQNFEGVDGKVRNYPRFNSITDLGYRIMNDFPEDTHRIRAAFIWLTHNIAYGVPGKKVSKHYKKIKYSSTEERDQEIKNFVFSKIDRSFHARTGVCIDYSLMLNALLEQFELPSKVISGIAKTDVKDIGGEQLYKNHSWNAVRIGNEWQLMDATWAAGYIEERSRKFVRSYMDHYFLTAPSDFVLNHFPQNREWQLLKTPVSMANFMEAPIFLPEYFDKGIKLAAETKGILSLKDKGINLLHFDELPTFHKLHYSLNGAIELKRMGFRKIGHRRYISRIRLKRKLKNSTNFLTVYHGSIPILNFKIAE